MGQLTCISFDYMQNLPLPHIKTSDVFYARQLWYILFGIHDLGNDRAYMNVYDEMVGGKGQKNVTSMLLKYFNDVGAHSETCVIFNDGCAGQNKNYTMVRFLFYLVVCLKLFKKFCIFFPFAVTAICPMIRTSVWCQLKKK